jgi:hypothetical protein
MNAANSDFTVALKNRISVHSREFGLLMASTGLVSYKKTNTFSEHIDVIATTTGGQVKVKVYPLKIEVFSTIQFCVEEIIILLGQQGNILCVKKMSTNYTFRFDPGKLFNAGEPCSVVHLFIDDCDISLYYTGKGILTSDDPSKAEKVYKDIIDYMTRI